ncbi:flagellar biosynthesis anti-sigma factor FlgM [Photobacterium sp.]|uniref:flagellar biosynthesis anti-sigma factor FlgM n=1 Tax=Photobacterium sp. TaxID=660 RepID=UPI00299EE154|nr:flagellar biosynthesis anti-sigma factor FlgM [Photobacterium sp.]MDX1301102.1 flagellar biosynthesis anti-sigma factor FlgM [Photobacterium sp.]
MKIDKVFGSQVQATQANHSEPKAPETNESKGKVKPNPRIDTTLISQAQAEMNTLPDVDMAKVESVKQALARGELDLDIGALSSAVMRFHTGHE